MAPSPIELLWQGIGLKLLLKVMGLSTCKPRLIKENGIINQANKKRKEANIGISIANIIRKGLFELRLPALPAFTITK